MKVRFIHNGEVRIIDNPDLVVVENNQGAPVVVAAPTGVGDTLLISTAEDPKFNQVLQQLGLDRTVLVQRVRLSPFKSPA